jgi:2-dehydropantoate 2-reductase
MGAVWASRLGSSGHDVHILDVSKEALTAIGRDGLVVEQKDGSASTFNLPATDDPSSIGECDAVVFFTKAHHTRSAAELARPLVAPTTTVASLQNGWGNADTLSTVFEPSQLVVGVTYHSAKVVAPGRVAHTSNTGPTYLGSWQDGAPLDRAQALGDAMTGAGIQTTVTPDVKTEIWKKLILNCATLPTSALTGLYAGSIGTMEAMLLVCDALATEASAVARAKGLEIDPNERISSIRSLLAVAGKGKASMLQDAEAKRKTEIEVINGAVVREADALGIDVPLNTAMVRLIHGLEASWQQ